MDKLERYLSDQSTNPPTDTGLLLREVAYERLKDAIRYADLPPGQPLIETRLSNLLGISRTPVREALQMLAQEGLVQMSPGQTVTIAGRSMQEVLNVVHIRSLLEPELARLVAESISQDGLDRLQTSLAQMEAAIEEDDEGAWSKADTVFHETLSDFCPNPLLGETILHLRNRVHHMANVDTQTNPSRLAACTREHREIVETIAARDPEAAERATRAHIDKLRESLLLRLSYGQ